MWFLGLWEQGPARRGGGRPSSAPGAGTATAQPPRRQDPPLAPSAPATPAPQPPPSPQPRRGPRTPPLLPLRSRIRPRPPTPRRLAAHAPAAARAPRAGVGAWPGRPGGAPTCRPLEKGQKSTRCARRRSRRMVGARPVRGPRSARPQPRGPARNGRRSSSPPRPRPPASARERAPLTAGWGGDARAPGEEARCGARRTEGRAGRGGGTRLHREGTPRGARGREGRAGRGEGGARLHGEGTRRGAREGGRERGRWGPGARREGRGAGGRPWPRPLSALPLRAPAPMRRGRAPRPGPLAPLPAPLRARGCHARGCRGRPRAGRRRASRAACRGPARGETGGAASPGMGPYRGEAASGGPAPTTWPGAAASLSGAQHLAPS